MKKTKFVIIDKTKYQVNKVLQDSRDLKEFELKDSKGKKFLFWIVLEKFPELWKFNKKGFCEENAIDVESFEFLK